MAFARLYISKFSRGTPGPPYDPSSYANPQADERPPTHQKEILDHHAYDLAWHDKIWQGKFTKHPPQQKDGSFAPVLNVHYAARFVDVKRCSTWKNSQRTNPPN